jgi:uracil-DNA glycosylase
MAIHTQLPIYKLAYELLSIATDLTKNMPRDYKASIGGTIRKECVDLMTLIFRANCAKDKSPYLDKLLERVQVAELLFRLSKDKRFISVGQYATAIALTDKIGRQANGWRKYSASSPAA